MRLRMSVGISPVKRSILVAMIWATAGSAQAQQVGDAAQGLRLAHEACAECHLVVKSEGKSPNPDAPTFEEIATTPGMTGLALAVALQTSHRTMPNIVIKGEDAQNVISYLLSLKESD